MVIVLLENPLNRIILICSNAYAWFLYKAWSTIQPLAEHPKLRYLKAQEHYGTTFGRPLNISANGNETLLNVLPFS